MEWTSFYTTTSTIDLLSDDERRDSVILGEELVTDERSYLTKRILESISLDLPNTPIFQGYLPKWPNISEVGV